ncbi:insulin-like growth factor-binding protein 3 isoform X2 [Acomys russatus]|uniref:insulin-like growth factor-binding protein 3 isoform X2 n=1 Tax=Acomys russatus TaxID=60746 RepID=UPI0021E1C327|nr:insulin-like growth factor-binding protein 3 isoform X2 [Acomys russatus]
MLPRCELARRLGTENLQLAAYIPQPRPACSSLRALPRRRAAGPPLGAMHPARPALWAAALTALTLLRGPPVARAGAGAVGAGPVVRCEPCDARALAQCAPPPTAPACTELVREPGCGCCLTCALREGDACGVYTERCGTGLRCQPRPAEQYPLKALLNGRGFCANASASSSLSAYLPSQHAPGNISESEEDHSAGSVESQAVSSTHRVTDSKFHPLHAKMDVIKKGHAKDSQRYKVDYESQSTDTQNFSSGSKRETEYVENWTSHQMALFLSLGFPKPTGLFLGHFPDPVFTLERAKETSSDG